MSEIKIYDPTGKCKHCMGSGHVSETVYPLNRWGYPNNMDAHVLVSHCPYCNGTGKPDEGEALADKAMQRREQGLIEGVKMDTDLHKLCVEAAVAMLDMDVTRHISYINGLDIPGVFKDGGKIIKVTIEFVDEDETRDDADSVS
jgi:hypothetical protein